MLWNMIVIEQQKLFKRGILWLELGLISLGVVAINLLFFGISQADAGSEIGAQFAQNVVWPNGLTQSLGLAAGPALGGILIVILVGAITAQEYTWQTLQLWLSRGVPRSTFLVAKFTAVLLPALLLVVTPLLVGGLTTAILSQVILGEIPVGEVAWGKLLVDTFVTAYTLLPYAALAFFLAVITRSTLVAVGGGLAYTLLIEGLMVQLLTIAGNTWAEIGRYLPASLAQALMNMNISGGVEVSGSGIPSLEFLAPEVAAVAIAMYCVVLVGLSVMIFRRQDLGG